jgi:hypothetical protein
MAASAPSPSARVTMRLAAVALMAMLVGLPLTVLPSPFLGALGALALVVGGAGAIAASVPLATAGGALALIEYALALVIARPDPDPVAGTTVGAGLVLLLASTHFAGRTQGAACAYRVIGSQARYWLAIVALGAVGATLLTLGGEALALALRGAALPVVVAAAALGALMTVAGVIALVTTSRYDT